MENIKPTLLITGVNGYIGLWVTLKALESGKYRVRGTVRNRDDRDKIEVLKTALGDRFDELELVNADLTDKDSIKAAVDGCDYILHVASPFPAASPKDEDEIIKPAVEGTLFVLEAAVGSKVKRIVTTSSCVAILDYDQGDSEVDETHTTKITKATLTYTKSKILAEKEAWSYIDSLPDEKKTFEYITINPGLVVGPLLAKSDGTSQEIISGILTGKLPRLPQTYYPLVDVRDVADAHIKALTAKPNERYALTYDTYLFKDIADIIDKEFGDKYGVTTKELSTPLAWMLKFFNADLNSSYAQWKIRCHVKNDKAKKELGIDFRPADKSIIEMCYSMIKLGMVENRTKK